MAFAEEAALHARRGRGKEWRRVPLRLDPSLGEEEPGGHAQVVRS